MCRKSFFGVCFIVFALFAAGCGSSGDDDSPTADPAETDDGDTAGDVAETDDGDTAGDAAETDDGDTAGDVAETDDGDTGDDSSAFVEMSGVPGVTDGEIRFSMLGTATANNPTGSCYLECMFEGVSAYFAYRNSDGGIYGRQLVLEDPINDELGQNQTRALEIISADDTFGVFTVPIIGSGFGDFEEAGLPVYTYLTAVQEAQRDNLFGAPFGTNCPECDRPDHGFIAREVGATRAAALGYSVGSSADCANGVVETLERYADETGGVTVEYLNPALDFGLANGLGPEVTAIRDAGVDIIYTCMDANGVKTLAEEVKRQGLEDVVIVQQSSFDEVFIGENAAAYENAVFVTNPRPLEGGEGTDRELFEEWMAAIGATPGPEIQLFGWYLAHLAVEGLEQAGAPFDRQSVIDATNAIEGFTANGLMPARDLDDQHLVPNPDDPATLQSQPYCWVIYQVREGEPELIAATLDEPWVCWDRPGDDLDNYATKNFS